MSADTVSYLSIAASSAAALCFLFSSQQNLLLIGAIISCILRLWCNMLDGMVAIESGTTSKRGEIVNEFPDRISDVLIFAGVAHSGLCHVALGYWAAIMALMTAYSGVIGQTVGTPRQFGGIMSKPWRMVVLAIAAASVLIFGDQKLELADGIPVFSTACVIVITGCVQTISVRLLRTFKLLSSEESDAI
ncbi:MAG: CDP-alcohol phosphatidyltransferase family protein [Planctomycetota bacterium]